MLIIIGVILLTLVKSLSSSCDDVQCIIELENEKYQLEKEEYDLFSTNAILIQDTDIMPVKSFDMQKRYQTKKGSKYLAIANIKENIIVHGIFSTVNGIIEIHNNKIYSYKYNITDITKENPQDLPFKKVSYSSEFKIISEYGKIDKWNPGCFPQDTITHILQMEIIVDLSLYDYLYTEYVEQSNDQKIMKSRVIAAIVDNFGFGKLVYLQQFNVRLEVTKITIATASDPAPLSNKGITCKNALGTFDDFISWNTIYKNYKNTSYTILLSNCFNGIVGVSYIGAICGTYSSAGVSIFNWLTIFHEIGHALGADHSFENGIGTTGGLMDYGDGVYNGVIQFHPRQYTRICPYLTGLKTWNCKYFFPVSSNNLCGDGIMSPDEECECLDGSQACGSCRNCRITDPGFQCTTKQFIARFKNTNNYVIVSSKELSHPTCCKSTNRLTRPKLLCDVNNICGPNGKCIRFCNLLVSWASKSCGFDNTGCIMSCTDDYGNCRSKWTSDGVQINVLPEGSLCEINSTLGLCGKTGNCIPGNSTINCTVYRRRGECLKSKCKWCRGKCVNKC